MRVIIQRVQRAFVRINQKIKGEIGAGLIVFAGIENTDNEKDIAWLSKKICNLRIFYDKKGTKNLSVKEIDGEILLISNFTLHARVKKGNRPSYIDAAKPEISVPLYDAFAKQLEKDLGKYVKTGDFGAYMEIEQLNDGPVTIFIDSKNRR